MKKRSSLFLISLLFSLFCLLYFEPSKAQTAQATTRLFDLLDTQRTQTFVSSAAVREQEIKLNLHDVNFEAARELDFPLFDGATYKAIQRESEGFVRFADDEFTWRGKIFGDNDWSGDVILTVKGKAMSGLIYSPDAVYEIVPQEDFKHLLVQIDQSRFPPCGGTIPAQPGLKDTEANRSSPPDAPALPVASALDDGSLIDVLVVYTVPLRSSLGGTTQTQAFIQQAIASTNTAYQNSDINPRLRLVNTLEVDYTENGSLSSALSWVRNDATVAAARNASKADMVAILVESGGDACGVAYVMSNVGPDFDDLAFSATQRSCAVGNLTFAHELGHNQGCEHNPENGSPPASASYPYAFGHYVNGAFRTVMSYADPCSSGCNRVAHFSNPSINFNGQPTGIANQRDNHRVINNTALVVSQFRESGSGNVCIPTSIAVGQTVNGALATSDCRYPTGSNRYSDAYIFGGAAGQQIAITMTSASFDTRLVLQNSSGTELAVDNNGGGGTNSRIPAGSGFFTLPSSDTYTIQAFSNTDNATGSYTLNLTAQGGAAYDAVLKAPKCATVGSVCDSLTLLNGRGNISGGAEPNQPNTINGSCADGTSGTYHADESLDAIKVSTLDGSNFAPGKAVKIDVTSWVWSETSDYLDLYYAADANNPNWVHITTLQYPGKGNQTLTTTYQLPAGAGLQAVRANFRFEGSAAVCGSNGGFDDHDDLIFAVDTGTVSTSGLQYYPLARPVRLLDTRPGQPACHTPGAPISANTSRTQAATGTCDGLNIPASAKVVVGNAAVVNNLTGAGSGFVTLYPSGVSRPVAANVNYVPGQIVSNAFTAGLGSDGAFQIYASSKLDVVVDVTGYYAPPGQGGLYYHPLPKPVRLLDTRIGQTACDAPGAPIQGNTSRNEIARTTCSGVVLPNDALAIVGNAAVINTLSGSGAGYLTLYPGGAARPVAANVNYAANQIVSNAFTVGLGSDGAFNIFTSRTLNVVVDVTGYYSASAAADANGVPGLLYYPLATPMRLLDTRPGQPACVNAGAPLVANAVRTQNARLTCGATTIPASALAVVGNAAVVNNLSGAGSGFITLYPSGVARPVAANVNYTPGQIVSNAYTVGLGSDGAFNIFALTRLDFVTDLSGYFAP